MTKIVRLAIAGILGGVIFTPSAFSQIEVIDATPETVYRSASGAQNAASQHQQQQGAAAGELFYQLQLLQEEVLQLRGKLEEQQHEIQRLKQQRLDDYINLDRRISSLGGAAMSNDTANGVASPQPGLADTAPAPASTPAPAAPPATDSQDLETKTYRDAYALVKAKKYPEATQAFLDYLAFYPDGEMTPNAYYWLGELYLLDANLAEARARFSRLLARYPDDRKVPDAMFKLARIYYQEGDKVKSRELLEQVINQYANSGSSAPRLAQEFLRQNF
jgi:tol-pal system protein YbgF